MKNKLEIKIIIDRSIHISYLKNKLKILLWSAGAIYIPFT